MAFVGAEVVEGGRDVASVPEGDGVDYEPEGAELVLLTLPVGLAQLPAPAVEDFAGQRVARLATVDLGEDAAAVGLIIEVGQQEDRLGDATDFGERSSKGAGATAAVKDPQQLRRPYRAGEQGPTTRRGRPSG